jgi:DNA-nicking Smr family endonuclease
MKPSNSSGMFKPFKNLKDLIERKELKLKPVPALETDASQEKKPDRHTEQSIFAEAMADVKRISRENCSVFKPLAHCRSNDEKSLERESVVHLKNLVKYGTGFIVSLTPEYIEGTSSTVNPGVARRLHRGDFSIQAHIDLHCLGLDAAHEAFDEFLQKSIQSGRRTVLVIHGRGLSSPAEPILKAAVYRWLTSSPWHKWVIAFTSARLCDGGAGATYVLLRQRPLTKKLRKKRKTR